MTGNINKAIKRAIEIKRPEVLKDKDMLIRILEDLIPELSEYHNETAYSYSNSLGIKLYDMYCSSGDDFESLLGDFCKSLEDKIGISERNNSGSFIKDDVSNWNRDNTAAKNNSESDTSTHLKNQASIMEERLILEKNFTKIKLMSNEIDGILQALRRNSKNDEYTGKISEFIERIVKKEKTISEMVSLIEQGFEKCCFSDIK